jgi:hypothetical protein
MLAFAAPPASLCCLLTATKPQGDGTLIIATLSLTSIQSRPGHFFTSLLSLTVPTVNGLPRALPSPDAPRVAFTS